MKKLDFSSVKNAIGKFLVTATLLISIVFALVLKNLDEAAENGGKYLQRGATDIASSDTVELSVETGKSVSHKLLEEGASEWVDRLKQKEDVHGISKRLYDFIEKVNPPVRRILSGKINADLIAWRKELVHQAEQEDLSKHDMEFVKNNALLHFMIEAWKKETLKREVENVWIWHCQHNFAAIKAKYPYSYADEVHQAVARKIIDACFRELNIKFIPNPAFNGIYDNARKQEAIHFRKY